MSDVPRNFAEAANIPQAKIDEAHTIGQRLLREKKYGDARAIFRGLATMEPDNLDHLRAYAIASTADGDHISALAAVDIVLRLLKAGNAKPRYRAEALALKASLLLRADQKLAAHTIGQEALALAEDDAPWRNDLERSVGDLARSMKLTIEREAKRPDLSDDIAVALDSAVRGGKPLATAFGIGDGELMVLHKEAVQLVRVGNLAGAGRIIDGLIALDPRVSLFHLSLGTVHHLAEDIIAADACFTRALAAAQNTKNADDLVADVLLRRGLFRADQSQEGAKNDLQKALAMGLSGDDLIDAETALEQLG